MSDYAIVEQNYMPAMSIQAAVSRYNAVVEFTQKVMKLDKDYGVIPGTGTKPTLLKPGAEKLCSLFGMAPQFELITAIEDFEKGLFYFKYRCSLFRDGRLMGTGIGSCNSREKKYRYRNLTEKQASDDDKARAVRVEEKSGKYGKYRVWVVENTEPFDLVNTLDKMAQKRALIAATLIAANASEFFTQDVEDMDFIDADYHEAPAAPPPVQQPKNGKGKDDDQPATPEALEKFSALMARAVEAGIQNWPAAPEGVTMGELRKLYRELDAAIAAAN